MKFTSLVLIVLAILAPMSRGDSIDDAEAKRRGVPVEQIQLERAQARIAELEKQVTDAKAPTAQAAAPATQPKTVRVNDLVKSLPATLKSKAGETERHVGDRGDWLEKNMAGKRLQVTFVAEYEFEGKVRSNDASADFLYVCNFTGDVGQKIYKGDTVVIEGDVAKIQANAHGEPDRIEFQNCRLVSLIKSKS